MHEEWVEPADDRFEPAVQTCPRPGYLGGAEPERAGNVRIAGVRPFVSVLLQLEDGGTEAFPHPGVADRDRHLFSERDQRPPLERGE